MDWLEIYGFFRTNGLHKSILFSFHKFGSSSRKMRFESSSQSTTHQHGSFRMVVIVTAVAEERHGPDRNDYMCLCTVQLPHDV